MLNFEDRLNRMINAAGSFEDIPWHTMFGQQLTLGTMTDEHVENCIQYHRGVLLMAEVTPGMEGHIEAATFIVLLQQENRARRQKVVDGVAV